MLSMHSLVWELVTWKWFNLVSWYCRWGNWGQGREAAVPKSPSWLVVVAEVRRRGNSGVFSPQRGRQALRMRDLPRQANTEFCFLSSWHPVLATAIGDLLPYFTTDVNSVFPNKTQFQYMPNENKLILMRISQCLWILHVSFSSFMLFFLECWYWIWWSVFFLR